MQGVGGSSYAARNSFNHSFNHSLDTSFNESFNDSFNDSFSNSSNNSHNFVDWFNNSFNNCFNNFVNDSAGGIRTAAGGHLPEVVLAQPLQQIQVGAEMLDIPVPALRSLGGELRQDLRERQDKNMRWLVPWTQKKEGTQDV